MTAQSDTWHQSRQNDTRRWTPVTEADLARDLMDTITTPLDRYRPAGWYLWQSARVSDELRTVRETEGCTR